MASSAGEILAANNWWGDHLGPNVGGSNPAGQAVQGDVTITNWGTVPYNSANSSKTISSAVFINNTVALYSSGSEAALAVTDCTHITGNSYGARAVNHSQINAPNSWWGSADGPDNGTSGSGDRVEGNVVYSPWAADANCATMGENGNTIQGQVTNRTNTPIPNVTVSTGSGQSTTTGTNGAYTLLDLATGAYTLTPSKSGYRFSPASRTINVPPDQINQNFTAIANNELVCSVEIALGVNSTTSTVDALATPTELLTLYTRLRDETLSTNSTGQGFIDLFYEHTTELAVILMNNPDLRSDTAQFLQNASGPFTSLLPDATTPVPLSQGLYNEADDLVQDLAAAGSAGFRTKMLKVWSDLALEEHIGENAADIWAGMQSAPDTDSVYLPVVIK
ncbi:MAG: carboxypeptidase regulatory-like domain-containing protein [Anaerolineales bacterium]|nr:carboxypeptidase regulatory-like domain-containing protein [Anaerolineales bacterium]